jgi:hypothetical protein
MISATVYGRNSGGEREGRERDCTAHREREREREITERANREREITERERDNRERGGQRSRLTLPATMFSSWTLRPSSFLAACWSVM